MKFKLYKLFLSVWLGCLCLVVYLYLYFTEDNCLKLSQRLDKYRYMKFMSILSLHKLIERSNEISRNDFKLVRNIISHSYVNDINNITLVTQCSANQLHHVIQLSIQWSGPITVIVFSDREHLTQTLYNIAQIQQCNLNNVAIHLVYPGMIGSRDDCEMYNLIHERPRDHILSTCTSSNFISSHINYNMRIPYPVNMLRNIGLELSFTKYVMVLDVDMTPSPGLSEGVAAVLSRDPVLLVSSVLVVPAFEVNTGVQRPLNKKDLMSLSNEGYLQPFYGVRCAKCQAPTNYSLWFSLPPSPHVRTVYSVPWKDPWEPFYISSRTVPRYDERFKQYGFNRISQVCEVHIAGYEFKVLDNAFVVHDGMKLLEGFHKTKDAEQESNRLLFRRFKVELKLKYPDSSRRCY